MHQMPPHAETATGGLCVILSQSMVVYRPRSRAHWASGMRYWQRFDTSLDCRPNAEWYSPLPPWWHFKKNHHHRPSCKILAP